MGEGKGECVNGRSNRWNSKMEGEGKAIGTFEFPARTMARPFFSPRGRSGRQNKFHSLILLLLYYIYYIYLLYLLLYLEFRFDWREYDFFPWVFFFLLRIGEFLGNFRTYGKIISKIKKIKMHRYF